MQMLLRSVLCLTAVIIAVQGFREKNRRPGRISSIQADSRAVQGARVVQDARAAANATSNSNLTSVKWQPWDFHSTEEAMAGPFKSPGERVKKREEDQIPEATPSDFEQVLKIAEETRKASSADVAAIHSKVADSIKVAEGIHSKVVEFVHRINSGAALSSIQEDAHTVADATSSSDATGSMKWQPWNMNSTDDALDVLSSIQEDARAAQEDARAVQDAHAVADAISKSNLSSVKWRPWDFSSTEEALAGPFKAPHKRSFHLKGEVKKQEDKIPEATSADFDRVLKLKGEGEVKKQGEDKIPEATSADFERVLKLAEGTR